MVLDSVFNSTGMYFLYIVLVFGAVCLLVFLIRKFVINKNKSDKNEIDENQAANETLSRYLEEVDDQEAQKQFDDYEKQQENK